MRLFDSHCHLDFPEFDRDRDEVLERAASASVRDVLIPGYASTQWDRATALSRRSTHHAVRLHVAVGVHPYALAEPPGPSQPPASPLAARAEDLVAAARAHGAVAIGECGLDGPRAQRGGPGASLEQQLAVLREHLEAAAVARLPLILHVVCAHAPALELLRATAASAPSGLRGVVHGYSGSAELVREYLDLDFMLAFGGALTKATHRRAREALRATPDEHLLLETDAPSGRLAAGPARNEPSALLDVARAAAQLRDAPLARLASQTTENALRLFGLSEAPA